jgi:hypothetical protein
MIYINGYCALRAKDISKIWIKRESHGFNVIVVTDPVLQHDTFNHQILFPIEGSHDKNLSNEERNKNQQEAESRAQACMERIITQIKLILN